MALFKVLRGNEEHLPQPDNNKDGYAYFTSDTHNFYINHKHTENGPVEQDLVGVGKNTIEGGEIFNDYENNQGISECSSAKGKNTIAGCRGYWYSSVGSVTINNVVHSTITLTNIHDKNMTESWSSSDICEYQPGDIISIIADNKYYNCATIKSINGNIITLNENLDKVLDGKQKYTYDDGFDGNIVYVISKPQFGNVDLGIAAMAEGGGFSPSDVTGAYGPFTHVEGRNNKAIGHYSHAEGRNNKAINTVAHVEGQNSVAQGMVSHAEGSYTKANGKYSHAEGSGNIADGNASHAEGNNTEAIGASSHAEGMITHATNRASHSEGRDTWAKGEYSHAEGYNNQANETASHVEGEGNIADGARSHAEGSGNTASGNSSHVEGNNNTAEGIASHAEGHETIAKGLYSHSEGYNNIVTGLYSHIEGEGNIATGQSSHVEGKYNIEDTENKYAHIVGNGQDDKNRSNAHTLDWDGNAWYAGEVKACDVKAGNNISLMERSNISNGVGLNSLQQKKNVDAWHSSNDQIVSLFNADKNPINSSGNSIQVNQSNNILVNAYGLNSNMLNGTSQALGDYSHAEGSYNIAFETSSHAEGLETFAQGLNSHAEGEKTTAIQESSHAEGYVTKAGGKYSHAEGQQNGAYGEASHAEGYGNSVIGKYSHVEGQANGADGEASHAEGYGNWADAKGAHAEGISTSAFYSASHAEGDSCVANAIQSHAEGYHTEANAGASHVEGAGTISNQYAQHVQGKYNLQGNYAHIVGNGKSDTNRSNAHTLDWNGKAWYADVITSSVFDKKFKDKSGNPIPRRPAQTSLYFGTLKSVVWSYSDWCENSQSPYITLQRPNRHPISGRLTDLFPPEEYDITISPTDDMIIQYGEEMADAGLQVLSNGTMYVRDEYMLNNLINKDITINITIYYTGKGVMDV